jgi:hypothetical protein
MWGHCNDADVTYEWDEQASKEAAAYPINAPDADALSRQCSKKAAGLGADGVRGHTVCSQFLHGKRRSACRMKSPGRAAFPVVMSSTSGSRCAPGGVQPLTCSSRASSGAGAPPATARVASA